MKRMIAKYRGRCAKCAGPIAVGSDILFFGRGHAEHVACGVSERDEDEAAGLEAGTLATDRELARRGITVVRFASGESFTQNRRGRCEDAPCCGCCG